MLAPLIDNMDDWRRLRAVEYGSDELLRQCDVSRQRHLAKHILCAVLYTKEIAVLSSEEDLENTSLEVQVRRHLAALQHLAQFQQSYVSVATDMDWPAIESYFASAIEHAAEQRLYQY